MTSFALTDRAAHDAADDVLVIFAAPSSPSSPGVVLLGGAALDRFPAPVTTAIVAGLGTLRARGGADEVTWLVGITGVAAGAVAVAGVGGKPDEDPSPERVRRAAGAVGRALGGRRSAAVVLPDDDPATVGVVAEGLGYGAYAFTAHRGEAARATAAEKAPVAEVTLYGADAAAEAGAALSRAELLVSGVAWARDLVNTAPNVLYPESFADRVREAAESVAAAGSTGDAGDTGGTRAAVSVTVHDAAALADLGCGGFLGVGQGSAHPPVLVRMSYAPTGATTRLAYVGKGITFDSGGLCLKTPGGMITMKSDMGGAAAVAAAVLTIARLGLPVAVDGWLCLAENMPDGSAQRPGDVVTMADGTTCEIINTDAEGRLVLADGLVLASRERPDAIVDIATLTGSAIVALGHRTAAVLANDDDLQAEVASAATDAGEAVWPMPIPEELAKGMESLVADRKHAADREGGASFAAAFLAEFVGSGDPDDAADPDDEGRSIPWVHLDIAGPSYNDKAPHGYTGKGGTGFGTRTLVRLAELRS